MNTYVRLVIEEILFIIMIICAGVIGCYVEDWLGTPGLIVYIVVAGSLIAWIMLKVCDDDDNNK